MCTSVCVLLETCGGVFEAIFMVLKNKKGKRSQLKAKLPSKPHNQTHSALAYLALVGVREEARTHTHAHAQKKESAAQAHVSQCNL